LQPKFETMIIVQVKEGENLEKSINAFKKKFQRIGIVKELRARKVYNKPSIVRRQKKLKAVLRQKFIDSLE
jgi:small subunit ribosomal protein S21